MNPVKEATNTINDLLKMVGEGPIPLPTEGTSKQKLESLLDIYTDRLIAKNPQYKVFKNKMDIPDLAVNYLKSMIDKQKSN